VHQMSRHGIECSDCWPSSMPLSGQLMPHMAGALLRLNFGGCSQHVRPAAGSFKPTDTVPNSATADGPCIFQKKDHELLTPGHFRAPHRRQRARGHCAGRHRSVVAAATRLGPEQRPPTRRAARQTAGCLTEPQAARACAPPFGRVSVSDIAATRPGRAHPMEMT
jgi:hypothetical protein